MSAFPAYVIASLSTLSSLPTFCEVTLLPDNALTEEILGILIVYCLLGFNAVILYFLLLVLLLFGSLLNI